MVRRVVNTGELLPIIRLRVNMNIRRVLQEHYGIIRIVGTCITRCRVGAKPRIYMNQRARNPRDQGKGTANNAKEK